MRIPYHARTTGSWMWTTTDVSALLEMAVHAEACRHYPEAYTYLRAALAAEARNQA